jgi:hypothetical protein
MPLVMLPVRRDRSPKTPQCPLTHALVLLLSPWAQDTPFQQLRLTEPIRYPKPSSVLVELPTMSSGQVILLACPFLIAYEEANCHP